MARFITRLAIDYRPAMPAEWHEYCARFWWRCAISSILSENIDRRPRSPLVGGRPIDITFSAAFDASAACKRDADSAASMPLESMAIHVQSGVCVCVCGEIDKLSKFLV